MELTTKELQLIHAALVEDIVELRDEWEEGKFQDKDLDLYIEQLCQVRDKVSKMLRNTPQRREEAVQTGGGWA